MDTVEFLEKVSLMWNQGESDYWDAMKKTQGVSNLVDIMRKEWWGNAYLKYHPAVRDAFKLYPQRILSELYIEKYGMSGGWAKPIDIYNVDSRYFNQVFRRSISKYFLNDFNPKDIVKIYPKAIRGNEEKGAIERINDSGKNGIWFLSFTDVSDNTISDWNSIKTLLELNQPFVLGYSELVNPKLGNEVKKGLITVPWDYDGFFEQYNSLHKKVISWDFNSSRGKLYWNLNQTVHLITRTGFTFNFGEDFLFNFMNWDNNPM